MQYRRFVNKNVIITGSGRGIGQATAFRFADEGADVMLIGRTVDILRYTEKRISESGLDKHRLKKIKQMFVETGVLGSTQKTALYYIDRAKHELNKLEDSDYKRSLGYLTDYITQGTDYFYEVNYGK